MRRRNLETRGRAPRRRCSERPRRAALQGFFDKHTPGAAAAMPQIADAVAHCRFEETDHDADEVVLARILQVGLDADIR